MASSLTIHVNNHNLTPFYASIMHSERPESRERIALILIDISGSMMNRIVGGATRFDAAKSAVGQFVRGFENGKDRVAIVPFESRQVAETIRSARFASSAAEAQRELDSLPTPGPRNNTALFSAVDDGFQVLEQQLEAQPEAEAQLFVVTDGSNDVDSRRGDDPGLLTGEAGLEAVIDRARIDSRIKMVAVGVGDPREVDAAALKAISDDFTMATDAEGLKKVFSRGEPQPVSSEIEAMFISPWPSRAALAGRTLYLRCSLQFTSSEQLESNEALWRSPQMGVPLYSGRGNANEISALMKAPVLPGSAGGILLLRPILVFAGLGGLLAILGFGIPKLIWGDEYGGHVPTEWRGRWAATTVANRSAAGIPTRPAPPGFEPAGRGANPPPRAPMDETRVLPANMTTTRIRLEQAKRPPDR